MSDTLDLFRARIERHRSLYDAIAKSHPSLMRGKVWCGQCGRSRTVDAATCLRSGWPKCCSGTMSIEPAAEVAKP